MSDSVMERGESYMVYTRIDEDPFSINPPFFFLVISRPFSQMRLRVMKNDKSPLLLLLSLAAGGR
jgi:hypothetical protein